MPGAVVIAGPVDLVLGEDADHPLRVDPSGTTTQPVSANSLPLPSGAATETTLGDIKTKTNNIPSDPAKESGKLTTIDTTLTSIKGKTDNLPTDPAREGGNLASIKAKTDNIPSDPAKESGKLTTIDSTLTSIKGKTDNIPASPSQEHTAANSPSSVRLTDGTNFYKATTPSDTQPISASALPLPSGAATETTLGNIKTKTDNLDVLLSTRTKPSDQQHAIVDSSALPSGASTETTLASILAKLPASIGQKVMSASLAVTMASDQQAIPVSMSSGGYGGQVEGRAADATTPVGNPVYIAGSDGTVVRKILTDSAGRIVIAPTGSTAVRRGFASGRVVLSALTVVEVNETTYTEPTSAAQRSLVSASANDSSAGTGARTVRITYFDNSLNGPFTEVVTLNGTTAVNTVATDIRFIEKMEVLTVGSGLVNAGIISLKSTTGGGGTTIWSVAAGSNQTFSASNHYVPVGYSCFITGFTGGIKGADTSGFLLKMDYPLTANSAENQISDQIRVPSSGQSIRNYGTPIVVVGPARVEAYAAPDSTSSRTYYASFDYYEQAT